MRKLFLNVLGALDQQKILKNVETLWRLELPQTFNAYEAAARQASVFLREAGFEDTEVINFPADGRTAYQDKRMPLAWNAALGRLTIKESVVDFENSVIADYQRHPFELIRGSVATPEEGLVARIITESQMNDGQDATGALVLCDEATRPEMEILKQVLDRGGLGIISAYDFYKMNRKVDECQFTNLPRKDTSDLVYWINNCTEGNHWHVQADDRPFIGFSVSVNTGDVLREAAEAGVLTALVECDGKRQVGNLPVVTGIVPGRRKKEFWLLAHLFEPLSDDNATGVVGAIEVVQALKRLIGTGVIPEFEFTIRVVFSSEMYGYAAFTERIGGDLADKVVGAINLDSLMAGNPGAGLHIILAPPGSPFFGDYLMEMLVDACSEMNVVGTMHENGGYGDDTFLNDRSIGLPTVWAIGRGKHYWHNSILTMEAIDINILAKTCAFVGSWISMVVTSDGKNMNLHLEYACSYAISHLNAEFRRVISKLENGQYRPGCDLHREIVDQMEYRMNIECARISDFSEIANDPGIESVKERLVNETAVLVKQLSRLAVSYTASGNESTDSWFEHSAAVMPLRVTIGFPHDLVNVPKEQRRALPGAVMYGALARILSNMDGKKSLRRLIREAEWEECTVFSDEQIKEYVEAINYLARYGYISL